MIRPNDLVFDVGASVGDRTKAYLRQGARVVAFEPEPHSFAKLQRRFRRNANAILQPVALAAQVGTVQLAICTRARTISTCAPHWQTGRFRKHHWTKTLEVPTTTLDTAIALYGRPQFIKIDVEGYEAEVLTGLSQTVPYLSFEFAHEFPGQAKDCLHWLAHLGYRDFNVLFGQESEFALDWCDADRVVEAIAQQPPTTWGDIYAREKGE